MSEEFIVKYKDWTLPFHLKRKEGMSCVTIEFTYNKKTYAFEPHALVHMRDLIQLYMNLPGNAGPPGFEEFRKIVAQDIMRAFMTIFYQYQSDVLRYATYHLKHYPLYQPDSWKLNDQKRHAFYHDILLESACRAIIDTDFFSSAPDGFEKVKIEEDGLPTQ